jgi:hypothetical protein
MAKNNITTSEGLAALINETMASKEDVQALDKKVTEGFDRIEHLIPAKQEQGLNDVEVRMKKLKDALAV